VAHTRPRGEHEHEPCVAHGTNGVALSRFKVREKARPARHGPAIRDHLDFSIRDHQIRPFMDLVFL
jgi:hypothetical protein